MATRRMRIKAVINVSRKTDTSHDPPQSITAPSSVESVPLSPAPPIASPRPSPGPVSPAPSPATCGGSLDSVTGALVPMSPGIPPRVHTPPVISPSPQSPVPSSSWALQRPAPSKSPVVCLPPSGSVVRRSPSPALSRFCPSPGPPGSPVKSPAAYYPSPLSPMKHSRALVGPVTNSVSHRDPPTSIYVTPASPGPGPPALTDTNVKSQPSATKFAAARKEFYEKLNSGQVPDKNKLTVLHFTFYNPPDPNKKVGQRKSRSRASSICSDVSTLSKHEYGLQPPINNENLVGKATSAPSSIAGSRRTTASSVGSATSLPVSEGGQSEAGSTASNASSGGNVPGPRVKVGPDGQLIIDEKSLVVETSESQRARKQIEDMEVVSGAEYAVGSSGFYRYKKSYRRGNDWTPKETVRFYRALNQCGTDFSMMQKFFPGRTRQELKSKFKREDRKNPDLISKALQSCVFDLDDEISDEEDSKKKEGVLNEMEEVVVCSAGSDANNSLGLKKLKKKNKDMEFSKQQLAEMKANLTKGQGTGKGRKWNTPVEGLVGGKVPKLEVKIKEEKSQPTPPIPVKTPEPSNKPKRKYVRKKVQDEVKDGVSNSQKTPSEQNVKTIDPGTINVIVDSKLSTVKLELVQKPAETDLISKKQPAAENQNVLKQSQAPSEPAGKRRSRLPKTKPNLKAESSKRKLSNKDVSEAGGVGNVLSNESNPAKETGVEVFCFGTSDPISGQNVPLPVAEETVLGNSEEELSGNLLVVDLDELKSVQSEVAEKLRDATPTTSGGKRKRKNSTSISIPVKLAPAVKDPYSLPSTSSHTSDTIDNPGESCEKRIKLPYRVPGPGGAQLTTPTSDSSELVLEITLSES